MFVSLILLLNFVVIHTLNPLVGLNTAQLIESFGYPSEIHYTTSQDGYILGLHRIPNGRNRTKNRKAAVLILPGMSASSADYVNKGVEESLGFILADNDLDVWISNNRGSSLSRNHTYLLEGTQEYWDFSWHEIAYYDLPAMIDYILKLNGDNGVFLIGHSQGNTIIPILGATRPEYNKKIKMAAFLAPTVFMNNVRQFGFRIIGFFIDTFKWLLILFKIKTVFSGINRNFIGKLCDFNKFTQILCFLPLFLIGCNDLQQTNTSHFPVILSNDPETISIKQLYHYRQTINSKIFAHYDYGFKENFRRYGQEKAPIYNISKLTAPVILYHGKGDELISMEDIDKLTRQLPNVVKLFIVPFEQFNHVDFVWAVNASNLVYNEILNDIKAIVK